jgi:type I restriction enzyme M protein
VAIRDRYAEFVELYPGVFTSTEDKTLRLADQTIAYVVDALSGLKLLELGVSTVALAFQVLRSEALKQGEGQYFTPQAVIEAGVRLMNLQWKDLILDPACGTGGFLVQSILEMRRTQQNITDADLSKWAQTHVYGLEKDAIGIKMTKAIMQIAGDGSAHCMRGDSIRTYLWSKNFPHLNDGSYKPGRFSAIITNPPFGKNLKVSGNDARLAGLDIAEHTTVYADIEIGILFLQRCHTLLKPGGRLGIVLPETYFFSPNYRFVMDWVGKHFRPVTIANIPMEAFQGFCRAKTNFYVFEKLPDLLDSHQTKALKDEKITFLNPRTCGIYNDGGPRYKIDRRTGKRTDELDNQLIEHVDQYNDHKLPPGASTHTFEEVFAKGILVPTYYDTRFNKGIEELATKRRLQLITLGELVRNDRIKVLRGHGSPSHDQRVGQIPYVKVSDIRALRVNINPTNLVSLVVAERYWRGKTSGLKPYDLITPNRASSNIGEFAILLPNEEQVVLTKEVFVFRTKTDPIWTPFYLLWALCLKPVRDQWRRIALMQTNREDCGDRWKEIVLPNPESKEWAARTSAAFERFFQSLADARLHFGIETASDRYEYIATVRLATIPDTELDESLLEAAPPSRIHSSANDETPDASEEPF